MEERNRIILKTVRDMLARNDVHQAVTTVGNLHAADAGELLSSLELADELAILSNMDPRLAAHALLEMEGAHQLEVASKLRTGELYDILENMPVDEVVDLLGDIPEEQRAVLLRLFGREEADELEKLLSYSDDSAGGLMTPDYVSVSPTAAAQEVIEQLRAVSPDTETIYYVYVISDDGRLEGVLSLRELIVSPPGRRVESMMSREIISVGPNDEKEEVARVIGKYDLLAVPVTTENGRMLGIVTVDDALDVIEDEAREDIMRFAGAAGFDEEQPAGLLSNLGRRLPWFVLAVVLEIIVAGGILRLYSPVLEKFLVLIFFIPLLVTMGGNISLQSSAMMVQWITGGSPSGGGAPKAVLKEIIWGVLVGVLAGGAVAGLSFLFHYGTSVGLVVGISLALTVLTASIVGCAMPFIFRALRRDPAAISGPFMGTMMDVVSLAIYMGIGTMLI